MVPKKAIVITVILLVAGLAWMVIYALTPRGYITLQIAPKDAVLSIDSGKAMNVSRGKKITVTPGEHSLSLSRDEFSTETITASVKNGETKTVMIALTPQTDAARSIINSDPDSVAIYEGYGSGKVQQNITKIEAENPAYKNLPISTQEYYIYTCLSLLHPMDTSKRAICVDLTVEGGRDDALAALRTAGIDITKEEVYIGIDAKVRPIIHANTYTVDYYHDLSTDKPTFIILVTNSTKMDNDAYTKYLLTQKDTAISALKTAGYDLDSINIAYVNPELTQFNSSPNVKFPVLAH